MIYMRDLVAAFAPYRREALVVSGRAGAHWIKHSESSSDLPLGDPSMGGHAGFSLGLALAQPNRRVVVFDSEGDLLMNLGVLATMAEQAPTNLLYFLMDNECYATTGGQPVPNAKGVAYDVIARGCGLSQTYFFDDLAPLKQAMPDLTARTGPVFVWTKIYPEIENRPIGSRVQWRKRAPTKIITDTRAALTSVQ